MFPTIQIRVGSTNPVKVNAVKTAFSAAFVDHIIECIATDAPSDVAAQPMTEQETLQGAINRVAFCQQFAADYYVAIEGGVDHFSYGAATFAYVVIANANEQHVGRGANLPLPTAIYQSLLEGKELGPLMDELFNTHNIKQKGGAIGLLTNGLANREGNYHHALLLALAPFLHPALFAKQ
ncbi:inosine/xanthosine triphosphatase [Pseudoalteromonas tunicata]|uniref:inosine/xanthosine triphosphatase n=1 Tax=Pseudoalteromonas tunicata TaxID=314281 RepID=UPI00273F8B5F|nr:inosine/xanthosine triphosphatase [Pseudoalteromonas tunicata]MDP5211485.1 inosine/xanthosine triphosphatase [Pseudoalteromonas tunicata]